MGAILAILGNPEDPELGRRLDSMIARCPHRGEAERHLENGFALATMSLGWDASLAASGDRVTAFHGWIGNWPELDAAHGLHWPAEASDAEKMAVAHEALGDDLFARLRGEWAVLIHDRRRRTLLAARDALGNRPLFFQPHDGRLFVATEIRQALAGSGHFPDLNEGLMARWLLKNYRNEAETAYRGVGRIRPSYVTVFKQADIAAEPTERQYWAPPSWDGSLHGHGSFEEIAERLRGILETAVRRALPDQPFAVALSGGLDSPLIMGLITRLADNGYEPARLAKPYSLTYPGMDCDESEHIRAVWRHNGTEGVMVDVSGEDFPTRITETTANVDIPPIINTCLLPMLTEQASGDGRSVMLTGHGGDHWFWSQALFLPHELLTLSLPTFLRDAADLAVQLRKPFAEIVLRRGLWPFVRGLTGFRRPQRRPNWITEPAWHNHCPRPKRISPWHGKGVPFAQAGLHRALENEQSGFVIEPIEQATAVAGGELRAAFMDLDLIETIFKLPPRILTAGKQWRGQQRQIAVGLIPGSVRLRTDKTVLDTVFASPVEQFSEEWGTGRYTLVRRAILDPHMPILARKKPSNPELASFLRLFFVSYELFSHRFDDQR